MTFRKILEAAANVAVIFRKRLEVAASVAVTFWKNLEVATRVAVTFRKNLEVAASVAVTSRNPPVLQTSVAATDRKTTCELHITWVVLSNVTDRLRVVSRAGNRLFRKGTRVSRLLRGPLQQEPASGAPRPGSDFTRACECRGNTTCVTTWLLKTLSPVAIVDLLLDFRPQDRGREDRLSRSPLPPNRTCGSPAYGSPVGGFTCDRTDRPGHGLP